MKGKILIFCDKDWKDYPDACKRFGIDFDMTTTPKSFADYAGLLLVGGADVDPALYGQKNTKSKKVNRKFDDKCVEVIKFFMQANKPILGICRGLQILNVALGGTLKQHIDGHKIEELNAHMIFQTQSNLFTSELGEKFYVNSRHHQCIDKLAEGLIVTHKSEDGVIECVEHENGKVIAVQWHPETLVKENIESGLAAFKIFKKLLEM